MAKSGAAILLCRIFHVATGVWEVWHKLPSDYTWSYSLHNWRLDKPTYSTNRKEIQTWLLENRFDWPGSEKDKIESIQRNLESSKWQHLLLASKM